MLPQKKALQGGIIDTEEVKNMLTDNNKALSKPIQVQVDESMLTQEKALDTPDYSYYGPAPSEESIVFPENYYGPGIMKTNNFEEKTSEKDIIFRKDTPVVKQGMSLNVKGRKRKKQNLNKAWGVTSFESEGSDTTVEQNNSAWHSGWESMSKHMKIRSQKQAKKKPSNNKKRDRPTIDKTDVVEKKQKPRQLDNINRRSARIINQSLEPIANAKFAGVPAFVDRWPNHTQNNNRRNNQKITNKQKKYNNYFYRQPNILETINSTEHENWLSLLDTQLENNDIGKASGFSPYLTIRPSAEQKLEWGGHIKVAQKVVNKIIAENQQKDKDEHRDNMEENDSEYDSSSSEDVYGIKIDKFPLQYPEDEVNRFFDSLLNNHVFDMGYNLMGINDGKEKYCWCPCSHNMKPWKEANLLLCYFNANSDCQKACGKGINKNVMGKLKKMNGTQLWKHVNDRALTCPIHLGIMTYLRLKYEDKEDKLSHKSMYIFNSTQYRIAEAKETETREK